MNMDESKREPAAKVAAAKLGIAADGNEVKVTGESILASMGGWVGVIESMLPGTAFVTVYAIWHEIVTAIVVSACIAIGFIARQIVKRRPLTQSVAGLIGIALAAYLPLRPGGSDGDYFIPGFVTNVSYFAVLALSILIRWPVIGILVSLFKGNGFGWRKESGLLRRFTFATAIWVVMFGLRLTVQLPFYFAGQIETLALLKLAMGTPLYALTIWLTWLTIRPVFKKEQPVA